MQFLFTATLLMGWAMGASSLVAAQEASILGHELFEKDEEHDHVSSSNIFARADVPVADDSTYFCTVTVVDGGNDVVLTFGGKRGSSENVRKDGLFLFTLDVPTQTTLDVPNGVGSIYSVRVRGDENSEPSEGYTEFQCVAAEEPTESPTDAPTLAPQAASVSDSYSCTYEEFGNDVVLTFRGLRGTSENVRKDSVFYETISVTQTTLTVANGAGSTYSVRLRGNGYTVPPPDGFTEVQCVPAQETTESPTDAPSSAAPQATSIGDLYSCTYEEIGNDVVLTFGGLRGTSENVRKDSVFYETISVTQTTLTVANGAGSTYSVRLRGNGYTVPPPDGYTEVLCVLNQDGEGGGGEGGGGEGGGCDGDETTFSDILEPCQGALLGSSGDFTDESGNGISKVTTFLQAEVKIGRQYDIFHDFLGGSQWTLIATQGFPYKTEIAELAADGRILFINWKNPGGPSEWDDIAAGTQDSIIDQTAQAIAAFGEKMFLTFHHEPEDNIASETDSTSARYELCADYSAAFQRIRTRFEARGATNVIWVWNMQGFSRWFPFYENGLYPGDAYVDWVSFNKYNWYGTDPSTSCDSTQWTDVRETFRSPMEWLEEDGVRPGKDKPVMIGEFGTEENSGAVNSMQSKADWLREVPSVVQTFYPRIKAMVYFDTEGRRPDDSVQFCRWGIDSSAAALAGMVDMAADPFFNQWFTTPNPEAGPGPTASEPTAPSPTEPSPTPSDDECFPGKATVDVEGKGTIAMNQLAIGDRVLVHSTHGGVAASRTHYYDRVFSFGHYDPNGTKAKYVNLETLNDGTVALSRNHMLSVRRMEGNACNSEKVVFVPASLVSVGDEIQNGEGRFVEVIAVFITQEQGMYAPFTESGTIVVNGFVASCYITFQESGFIHIGSINTHISFHWLVHYGFVSPYLFYSKYIRMLLLSSSEEERYSETTGLAHWVQGGYMIAHFLFADTTSLLNTLLLGLVIMIMVPVAMVASALDLSQHYCLSNNPFSTAVSSSYCCGLLLW